MGCDRSARMVNRTIVTNGDDRCANSPTQMDVFRRSNCRIRLPGRDCGNWWAHASTSTAHASTDHAWATLVTTVMDDEATQDLAPAETASPDFAPAESPLPNCTPRSAEPTPPSLRQPSTPAGSACGSALPGQNPVWSRRSSTAWRDAPLRPWTALIFARRSSGRCPAMTNKIHRYYEICSRRAQSACRACHEVCSNLHADLHQHRRACDRAAERCEHACNQLLVAIAPQP